MSTMFKTKKSHNCKYYDPYDESNINQVLPKLNDLKNNGRNDGIIKGVVRTFKDGVLLDECLENIVVANGRKYVAQRLFGTRHPSDAPVFDWNISHFGFGSGGAVISGATVSLLGPELCDLDLNSAIRMSGNPANPLHLTSPGDSIRQKLAIPNVAKSIEPSGLIDIILSDAIDCDYGPVYSYVRCVCVKSISEPNYLLTDDDTVMVNEGALYISNGASVQLFSHICFAPKYIERKSEFVLEWYILC